MSDSSAAAAAPSAASEAALSVSGAVARVPVGLKIALGLALLAALLGNYLAVLSGARELRTNAVLVESDETLYVPDTRTTRLLYLGYTQAAADIQWLRTIGYFARHFTSDRRYPWLVHFVDQIVALDPRFRRVYHWAGASVLYGQRFTNENIRLSNRFYEGALKQFPEDSEAAFRLGLNYYVEMHPKDAEERRRFQEKGATYIEMAANMPGAADNLRRLALSMYNRLGATEAALQSLLTLLESTEDPAQRAELRARMQKLEGSIDATALAEAVEAFERRRHERFEYLPPSLYLLLDTLPGPDVLRARSWRDLIPDVAVEAAPPPATEDN